MLTFSVAPLHTVDMPGPYYELASGKEFRNVLSERKREQMRREGRGWGLHP